jgi:hypothetical protein
MPASDSEKPEHSFPRQQNAPADSPESLPALSAICPSNSRARGPGSRDKSWRYTLERGRLATSPQDKFLSLLGLLETLAQADDRRRVPLPAGIPRRFRRRRASSCAARLAPALSRPGRRRVKHRKRAQRAGRGVDCRADAPRVCCEDEPGRRSAAKLLTRDKARRGTQRSPAFVSGPGR